MLPAECVPIRWCAVDTEIFPKFFTHAPDTTKPRTQVRLRKPYAFRGSTRIQRYYSHIQTRIASILRCSVRAKTRTKPTKSTVRYPRDGFARVAHACQFLQVGRTTLFRLMAAGAIQTVRFTGSSHRRIPWSSLWEFQERITKAGNGTAQYVEPGPQ